MQHDSCAIFFCCSLLNFGFCTENVEDALSEMCKCFVVLCDGALLWFLTRTFPEMYGGNRVVVTISFHAHSVWISTLLNFRNII